MKMRFNISFILYVILYACIKIKAALTDEEKKNLLTLHQNARNALHAPDMKDLSWDDTIAKGAQEYADECNGMVHSNSHYGENLAGASYNSITKLFELWMNEKKDFDESGYRANFLSGSYNGKAIGHYSQIVWAANSKLGCGYAYCSNLSMSYLLVCRYETGNYINQQVYAEPTSTSSVDDPNLKNEDTSTKDNPTNNDENKDSAESIYKSSFKMILFSLFLTIFILI